MKKLLISAGVLAMIALPMGAVAQTVPNNLGITSSTTPAAAIRILEEDLLSLYQQLYALLTEQSQLQTTQNAQAGQIQSLQQSTAAAPALGSATPSSTATTTPARPYHVNEEAEVNFGSGFVRGADMQTNEPTTTPAQTISGELVFMCIYDSAEPGLSNFCDASSVDTSTLPGISGAALTLSYNENDATCQNGIPTMKSNQYSETVTADASGTFSFSAPSSSAAVDYEVTVDNAGLPVLSFNAHNAAAPSISTICQ